MKCMSQYNKIMSLKMRWPWIWASSGIQTYESPEIWYWICSCTQDGRYDLLHTRAKIVYNFVLDYKIIL